MKKDNVIIGVCLSVQTIIFIGWLVGIVREFLNQL